MKARIARGALFTALVVTFVTTAWAGSDSARLPQDPWSGSWWPLAQCSMAFGSWGPERMSPLEKYDNWVRLTRGQNPCAAAIEADPSYGHNEAPLSNGESWTGHCHGWAAAALMAPECTRDVYVAFSKPALFVDLTETRARNVRRGYSRKGENCYRTRQDAAEGLGFDVADMKGYYTELWCACQSGFAGSRCNERGRPRHRKDYKDIYPHDFHKILEKYIKRLKTGFVADVDPGYMVWNHPAFAYESQWENYGDTMEFTTWVSYASDGVAENFIGLDYFTKKYTYRFFLDSQGNVTGSEWTGASIDDHPDFCWFPQQLYNRQNTPKIDVTIVDEIRESNGKTIDPIGGMVY